MSVGMRTMLLIRVHEVASQNEKTTLLGKTKQE